MKIRTLCIACVTTAAVLLVGCTAVYKNTDACEQMMRSKLADVSPEQLPDATKGKLSIDHRGTGIDGTRVVVEASLSRMQTAAEAAASAAKAASAPEAASAPAKALAAASGASATVASANPSKPAKPAKPKKLVKAVAAECTFTGLNLASFRWLAPKELVQTSDTAASETAE
jgi:murein L,D-transpeptidase YcbB/YkuD